ncbi:hypothetical protein G6F42_018897 [Rhizopus arrhizus]|nr:hypothetical protein G6F42_018897 [Rhizopus arrhizus]
MFSTIDYMFMDPQLFTFANPDFSTGLWRANPQLAQNTYFRQRLFSQLDDYHTHLASDSTDLAPQDIWDQIKELTRQIFKLCDQESNGEQSAGFLKRLTSQRSQQRAIPTLQHPSSSSLCASTTDKQAAAVAFYGGLYTADAAVNNVDINFFTSQIPDSAKIPDTDHTALCTPFATDELLDAAARAAPKQSSPGVDSLPYAILQLLFTHAATSSTAVRNWRPISLICCDARLMTHFVPRLTASQSGFMPRRLIGEPAMTLHCAYTLATATASHSIALLLDQETAYDRVNLEYLTAVLHAYNLPHQLAHSLLSLFGHAQVRVNVNGFLFESFSTQRGMQEGDPISPLLFNIIFDPFLHAINQDPTISRFDFQQIASNNARLLSSLTGNILSADPVKSWHTQMTPSFSSMTLLNFNNLNISSVDMPLHPMLPSAIIRHWPYSSLGHRMNRGSSG